MSSYPVPLAAKQLETIFQSITLSMLFPNVAPADYDFSRVRIGWQQTGQPAWKIEEDVCFVRAIEDDDLYNRIRDVKTVYNDPTTVTQITTYTRVWRVFWNLYGPTSFDNARVLRSGLFSDSVHDLLAASRLYWVTDAAAPRRIPEERDGQWWERVDFEAQFNEAVTETLVTGTVGSVEVLLETKNGVVRDIKVP